MNFYKRYPGDYGRKTAHLSLAEHGAYTLLLDTLYATEKGLPAGFHDLFRLCRAMSKDEQRAVASVVEQFFPVGEDGLRHNRRAAQELDAAKPLIETARVNGKRGGRPRKETQRDTEQKPTGFSEQNPAGSPEETRRQSSPDTRYQKNTPKPPSAPPDGFAEFWNAYPKKTAKPAALKAFKAAKLNGHLPEVLADIEAKKAGAAWTKEGGQFIPNPATYLNQRRWEDQGVESGSDIFAGAL